MTLELVSARGADRDRLLGVAYIANVGQTSEGIASYEVWLSKTLVGRTQEQWKSGRAALFEDAGWIQEAAPDGTISGFDNVRRGAWDLLYLVLRAVVGRRNA